MTKQGTTESHAQYFINNNEATQFNSENRKDLYLKSVVIQHQFGDKRSMEYIKEVDKKMKKFEKYYKMEGFTTELDRQKQKGQTIGHEVKRFLTFDEMQAIGLQG